MANALTNPWAAAQAALLHIMSTAAPSSSPPSAGNPDPSSGLAAAQGAAYGGASGPAGSTGMNYDPTTIKYGSTGGTAWQMQNPGPWNFFTGGPYAANNNQTDEFGNVYAPVDNTAWGGSYVDPKTLPGNSAGQTNAQLWGGATSDSPPAWLQKIVQDAANMPAGAAKTARIQHIMSSIVQSGSGANQHDLGYAERMFGISQ